MSGTLILVPTPLQEELPLEASALALLHEIAADPTALILVEELKVGRQRWLKWGLPRECIERFVAFNEHSAQSEEKNILPQLKAGARAVLMSDGGLPAFCDPGQQLVDRCHDAGVRVTATSFPNSIALALALSGLNHQQFFFQGFLPQKDPERSLALQRIWKTPQTQILMDTPYRRQRLLEELRDSGPKLPRPRRVFLALELNGAREKLLRGSLDEVLHRSRDLEKQEFILILDQALTP